MGRAVYVAAFVICNSFIFFFLLVHADVLRCRCKEKGASMNSILVLFHFLFIPQKFCAIFSCVIPFSFSCHWFPSCSSLFQVNCVCYDRPLATPPSLYHAVSLGASRGGCLGFILFSPRAVSVASGMTVATSVRSRVDCCLCAVPRTSYFYLFS